MKYLKNLIYEVVSQVVKSEQDKLTTEYLLIDSQTNKKIDWVNLAFKPQIGDIIDQQDGIDSSKYWRVKVQRVVYSHTGYTGELRVKKINQPGNNK